MYFWKIEELKNEIRANRLSERGRFAYAFIYLALCIIGMEVSIYMPSENPNIWDVANSIGNVAIPLIGTFFAFKANGAGYGRDFLGRFFSINFVVAMRFTALLIPMLAALAAYYFYAFQERPEILSSPIDTIPFHIWHAFLYIRTCKHIGDIRNCSSPGLLVPQAP